MKGLRFSNFRSYRPSAVALFVAFTPLTVAAGNDGPDLRVMGGEPAESCEWPTTVGLRMCTGTLIHPRVIIYAAHCGKGVKNVEFGEKYGSNPRKVATKFCKTSPGYKGQSDLSKGVDYAYCVLEEAVDMPIAPIIYGCELEELKSKPDVWVVGYGKNDLGGSHKGAKVKVETRFISEQTGGKEFHIGDSKGSGCNGDSGGPVYHKMKDGTWRTIGITSCGDPSCKSGAIYTNPAVMVPWMHKTMKAEGVDDIDVLPCFDDEGNWDPTPACGGYATDPGKGYGAWDNFCSEGAPRGGASATCGDAHPEAGGGKEGGGDKKDKEAPELSFSSPDDGDTFKAGDTVKVRVDAEDNVDKELEVVLYVDDKAQKADDKSPYTWSLKDLDAGEHELYAAATDEAGNEGKSKTITIEVEKAAGSGKDEPSEDGPSKDEPSGDKGSGGKDDDDGSKDDAPSKDGGKDDSGKGDGKDEPGGKEGCSVSRDASPWQSMPLLSALGLLGWGLRRRKSSK